MAGQNGDVPRGGIDFSQIPRKVPDDQLPEIGVNLGAIPRRLNSTGTFHAAQAVRTPDGQIIASPGRASYVDAEELVAMVVRELDERIGDTVRAIVRAELKALSGK